MVKVNQSPNYIQALDSVVVVAVIPHILHLISGMLLCCQLYCKAETLPHSHHHIECSVDSYGMKPNIKIQNIKRLIDNYPNETEMERARA